MSGEDTRQEQGMGSTKEETLGNVAEAILFHIEGMQAEGLPVPVPVSEAPILSLQ